ncbi:MAG: hypothetical protein Q8N18_18525 [Opitutaceae bacterium]|nr:hypothetical protein [Opitutaceae bacterium]
MNTHHFSYSDYQFAKVSFDPSSVCGRGGALAPALHLPASLELSPVAMMQGPVRGVLIQEIGGTAVVDHAGGFQLLVQTVPIQRVILSGPAPHHVELSLPVTRQQLEAIELARAQGDVSVSLQLRLSFLVLAPADGRCQTGFQVPNIILDAGSSAVFANFKIPQSVWAGSVLSGMGYGRVLLFELPAFPVAALSTLGEAFEAAKRAHAMFAAGEYDVTVGLCRTAVQPLRNHLKKIKEQAGDGTAADWAEKIGQATFDWLTTVTGKTHGVGSVAFHEGSSGRFSRLDAQMILTTTVSILAYAARLEKIHSATPQEAP